MVLALVISTAVFMSEAAGQTSSNANLALTGGTIYVSPADEPLRDGVVLIEGGKIAAVGSRSAVRVPPGVPSIDCSGFTILAGFWNSHVHFFERKWADAGAIPASELGRQLQDMLTRYGFTSVFDLSSEWENTRRIRDRIESGEVAGPRIRSTGQGLLPPNPGIPPDAVLGIMGVMKTPLVEVADAAQASAAAKKLLDAGVDGIKLFISSPSQATIPDIAIQAAAGEAHRQGKPVFAHPNTAADVLAAVRGGVNIVAHTTPRSGAWNEEVLKAMKERHVAVTPTLTLWKWYLRHDRVSAQEQMVNTAVGQLRAWLAAGGQVLFGTDLGAVEYDPSDEYALMAAAGMSFRQILASLTTAPAERFGESGRLGRIAVGLSADLTILQGNPAKDIEALTAVRYTIRDGKVVYSAAGIRNH
jgi:imidazolonepropionase-like amidohydrolase